MSELVKTILIVDDESFIRQSFTDYFEDRLWNIIQAESGEQAIELLQTNNPQGAIVDIRLGGMDGNDFIRQAYEDNPNMVFIICTGSADYAFPDEFLKLERVGKQVYKKPVMMIRELEQELIQMIDTVKS